MVVALSTSVLFAADWTVFHGPKGDNKSPDTGLLKQWPEGGPTLLWAADFIGYGYSSVTISGGRIFTSGNVEREGRYLSMVFCLDMDGNKIWENDNGPAHTERVFPGTRGTPTVAGNLVFDVSALGEVACFDAETGIKIWSRNLMQEYEAAMPRFILGHSLVVDGDNLICMVGSPRTLAVALNKRTGETVWESPPAAEERATYTSYITPFFFEFEGTRVVVVISNASVEGLDPETGERFFAIPWINTRLVHCVMPIFHNGYLFLTTGSVGGTAKLFQLTKSADGMMTASEVWAEPSFNNHHGGVILVGNYVYGTDYHGAWRSINFMSGEIGYTFRSSIAGKGSVVYADGLLYGLTENDRTVLLIRPIPNEFVLISSFELPNEVEGRSWAHPVVIGGRLYLRHAQYLYCFDVRAQ